MPVIFGDSFVGRIEAVPDRKTGVLEVKNIWWEPGIRVSKKLTSALDKTVKVFAKFNDCKVVKYLTSL